jgi:hypothetical protein
MQNLTVICNCKIYKSMIIDNVHIMSTVKGYEDVTVALVPMRLNISL